MGRLILHIGLRKSGTTSLQQGIFRQFCGDATSTELFTFHRNRNLLQHKARDREMIAVARMGDILDPPHMKAQQRLIGAIQESHQALVSNEMLFWRHDSARSISGIRKLIQQASKGKETLILLTLKNPRSLHKSEYRHAVKFGLTTKHFEDWSIEKGAPDYEVILSQLSALKLPIYAVNNDMMTTETWSSLLNNLTSECFNESLAPAPRTLNRGMGNRVLAIAIGINRFIYPIFMKLGHNSVRPGIERGLNLTGELKLAIRRLVLVLKRWLLTLLQLLIRERQNPSRQELEFDWWTQLTSSYGGKPERPFFAFFPQGESKNSFTTQ